MIRTVPFDSAVDFDTQRRIVELYREGTSWPYAPILHQALTGVAGMWVYLAWSEVDDADKRPLDWRQLVGAGMLKAPEAVMPIGQEIKPVAWAVSDMVTHPLFRRSGVARALLRHMEGVAYSNGGRILYLYTDETNEPACRLYEASRFTRLESQSGRAVFAKLLGVSDGPH